MVADDIQKKEIKKENKVKMFFKKVIKELRLYTLSLATLISFYLYDLLKILSITFTGLSVILAILIAVRLFLEGSIFFGIIIVFVLIPLIIIFTPIFFHFILFIIILAFVITLIIWGIIHLLSLRVSFLNIFSFVFGIIWCIIIMLILFNAISSVISKFIKTIKTFIKRVS